MRSETSYTARLGSRLLLIAALSVLVLYAQGGEVALAQQAQKAKPTPRKGERVHVVVRGDLLSRIARRYRVTVEAIRERNDLRKGAEKIRPKQRLIIPKPTEKAKTKAAKSKAKSTTPTRRGERVHVVARGDSLGRIARRYDVTVAAIRERNDLRKGGKRIQPEQRLIIPPQKKKQARSTKRQTQRRKTGSMTHCPRDMVLIDRSFCIDRYEAYVAIVLKGGKLRRHPPNPLLQ